jgi:hypothetical protein
MTPRLIARRRQLPEFDARAAADKRGVTRLQPRIRDVRAMSACVPTADVSLQVTQREQTFADSALPIRRVRSLRHAYVRINRQDDAVEFGR